MEFHPRVLIFLFISIFISQLLALECYTSKEEHGQCVEIRRCPKMLEIVNKKPRLPEDEEYLRNSTCPLKGSLPSDVIICCPRDAKQIIFPEELDPSKHLLLPADCGKQTEYRIVGGKIANIDEYPWMALLEYDTLEGVKTACAGVLISKRYVLTAAHCLKKIEPTWTLARVRLGEYNTTGNPDCIPGHPFCAPPIVTIPIERQILHEKYKVSDRNRRNDIALLRLSRDVSFTDFIQPICLPKDSYIENLLYSAGWGVTENRTTSDIKLKVTLPLSRMEDCISTYSNQRIFLGWGQFCAGGENGKDTCKGDSGGPLMAKTFGINYQPEWVCVGIVSFGFSECAGSPPGVYTKVHDFLPWILSNLKP